jgi:hypothetical protein
MWTWFVMDPGSCTLSCPAFIEFIGVLKGDVSGPGAGGGEMFAMPTALMRLGIARSHDTYVDIPVLIEDATDVYSVEFEFAFDNGAYSFVEVRTAGVTGGSFMSFREEDGHVNVALASATPFSGGGRMAMIRLEKRPSSMPGTSIRPNLVRAMLNEGAPAVEIDSRGFNPVVENFRLGPVSPNPFSQGTVIAFTAPGAADVSIDIYNVNGRLVRTVFGGRAEGGDHHVGWDGTDNRGARVARGVYFCRMNTEGFSATEKVVVLQ